MPESPLLLKEIERKLAMLDWTMVALANVIKPEAMRSFARSA